MSSKDIFRACAIVAIATSLFPSEVALAQQTNLAELYDGVKAFQLSDKTIQVEQLRFERDRVKLLFDGVFYLAEPVDGRVYGAVFVGRGRVQIEPWSDYEKDNVKRFLKSDVIDVKFERAVLRFTDDTLEQLQAGTSSTGRAPKKALDMIRDLEGDLLKQTGMNLSARLVQAVSNEDTPGVFFGSFDGAKPGKFNVLLDHQGRVPTAVFDINGGEKGLVWQYRKTFFDNDIWTAFYNQADFDSRSVSYSDKFDLVVIKNIRMDIDLTDPDDWLRYTADLEMESLRDGLQVLPISLNEGLSEYDNYRLKKSVKVLEASQADGTPVDFIQEDWETGFSLIFPRPLARGEKVTVRLKMEGKDSLFTWERQFHYLRTTTTWYPRHGYLNRSNYDLRFRHAKKYRVVSIGDRVEEGESKENPREWITRWVTRDPVALVTFAVGRFERYEEIAEIGDQKIPIEFYSLPSSVMPVKEDFVAAELSNGVRYFSELYGDYPYGRLGAVFFPGGFGQGFPTLLLLPVQGHARTSEFAFIAHEGAHQWWGNIVAWRSYRDQWLSEGFAEYSGVLYAGWRKKDNRKVKELVDRMRRSLLNPPRTETGVAKGKLYEVGPLILGHRVSTRQTLGAYSALVYDKGALVLRMLHFLFTDPSDGDGQAFFDMMQDFVKRHHGGWATTESFMQVASEHFAKTPIAEKFGLQDLKWFFSQWVFQARMPSYEMRYRFERRPEGGVLFKGTIRQEGVPDDWFMPLPLRIEFSGQRVGRGTVHAFGPETSFEIPLPELPKKVRLDPGHWVLSAKTGQKKTK